MKDRYGRPDAEKWQDEPLATDVPDYVLQIEQALDRIEEHLSLTRGRAVGSRRAPLAGGGRPDHPRPGGMLWAGGVGLSLSLGAMLWVIIAVFPQLAARAEYFVQAGSAALARSVPSEPAPRRWPE